MEDGLEDAQAFERERPRLHAIAVRMLGPTGEADDVVQEAWLRLHSTEGVEDLPAWLTTVVSRLCLDVLRRRSTRREDPLEDDPGPASTSDADSARQAELADSISSALLIVLDALQPAERLAFVLHDLFGVPFGEVARLLERSPDSARQLASRARRRVRGGVPGRAPDPARHAQVVTAFLTAAREGDLDGLIAMLDPQAVLRSDAAAVRRGAPEALLGRGAVARRFSGGAQTARPALLDGEPGLVWVQGGVALMAFHFVFVGDTVAAIEMKADPDPERIVMLTMRGTPVVRRPTTTSGSDAEDEREPHAAE